MSNPPLMVGAVRFFRGPLTVDFRQRYHLSLNEAIQSLSWNELWALTSAILRDPYSHTVAAAMGHGRAAYPVEETGMLLMDFYRITHKKKNSSPVRPLPRSWQQPPAEPRPVQSLDQKRAARRKLAARLGLKN